MATACVKRCSGPADFLAAAGSFLAQREAEHNLIFGIISALNQGRKYGAAQPYLAAVSEGGSIVLAALRTPPHNVVLSHPAPVIDAAQILSPLIEDLLAGGHEALPGVLGPSGISRRFAEMWSARVGTAYQSAMALRIHKLERVLPIADVPGSGRAATGADTDLLVRWFGDFARTVGTGETGENAQQMVQWFFSGGKDRGLFLWCDCEPLLPVSMAGYGGPTPHGIRINAVYTPPEHRGRGYATACVAALSRQLLTRSYQYCFLFTDVLNQTSNHIYGKIGYKPVCDVDEYRFVRRG